MITKKICHSMTIKRFILGLITSTAYGADVPRSLLNLNRIYSPIDFLFRVFVSACFSFTFV